jgi:hypothetical protein
VTGLPRWNLDQLVPLASRYPRAKAGARMEALAVAHLGCAKSRPRRQGAHQHGCQ